MEVEKVAPKEPTDHGKNQKGNQNMHRNKWKHDNPKPMGFSKSSAKGKIPSITSLPQETREKSNNNLNLHLKQLEKQEIKNPRVSKREEIIKIKAETNEK